MSRRLVLAASILLMSTAASCTLAKPVVCAVTTPVYLLANSSNGCFCGCDPRALGFAAVAFSAVGAVSGLVTGLISDINVLCGVAEEPFRNLHDPFATNNSRSTFRD